MPTSRKKIDWYTLSRCGTNPQKITVWLFELEVNFFKVIIHFPN